MTVRSKSLVLPNPSPSLLLLLKQVGDDVDEGSTLGEILGEMGITSSSSSDTIITGLCVGWTLILGIEDGTLVGWTLILGIEDGTLDFVKEGTIEGWEDGIDVG